MRLVDVTVFALASTLAACGNANPEPAGGGSGETSSAVASASVTHDNARTQAVIQFGEGPRERNDRFEMPRPPAVVPASQHPGHFSNKVVEKPAQQALAAGDSQESAEVAAPDYIEKEQRYVEAARALEETVSDPAELSRKRSALKASILGEK
jgi:hypothetical protein